MFGSLLGTGLVLALAATARPAGPLPRLSGPALAGPTHLRLIVSGGSDTFVPLVVDSYACRMISAVTPARMAPAPAI